jgi:hypothetical protein
MYKSLYMLLVQFLCIVGKIPRDPVLSYSRTFRGFLEIWANLVRLSRDIPERAGGRRESQDTMINIFYSKICVYSMNMHRWGHFKTGCVFVLHNAFQCCYIT